MTTTPENDMTLSHPDELQNQADAELPPRWVTTAPQNISIGWCTDSDPEDVDFPTHDLEDVCWSEGKSGHGDLNVNYIRADLSASALAQRDAEIDELRRKIGLYKEIHRLGNDAHERAERAESNLSAAKELLREARCELDEFGAIQRTWGNDSRADGVEALGYRIDAFLQEKPGAA